jgi:hypothetical protein
LRKSLYAFVIVTGILTALTVIPPDVLFLYHAFGISPRIGYIIVAAPMAFLISVALLIGNVTLRKYGVIISLAVPALLLVTMCVALPMYWNRPLNAEMANLIQGDRGQNEYKVATKKLALLLSVPNPEINVKPTDCIDVCQRLLFNGSVPAVLMGSPPFDGNNRVVRYRIERRPTCPAVNIPFFGLWDVEPFPGAFKDNLESSRNVRARVAAGECLIAEETDIFAADVVIVEQLIKQGANPCCRSWQTDLDTLTTRRLSIYELRDGSRSEIYRRTSFRAQPIYTPLFVSRFGSCSDGSECSLEMSIGRKMYRVERYDLREFLKTSTDLNVAPVSR